MGILEGLPEEALQPTPASPGSQDYSLRVGATAQPVIPARVVQENTPPNVDDGSFKSKLALGVASAFMQHLAERQPAPPANSEAGQRAASPQRSTLQNVAAAGNSLMTALGDASAAQGSPQQGWLGGVANVLNARNQRLSGEAQQKLENERQAQRDAILNAKSAAETVAMVRNNYQQSAEHRQEFYKGNQHFIDTYKQNHAVEEGVTQEELAARMQKDKDFPSKYYVRPTAEMPVFDSNGMEKTDKNGNPITIPTYAIVTQATKDGQPDDKTVSPEMSASTSKYLGTNLPEGTKLTGKQYNALDVQLNSVRSATNIVNNTNEKELTPEQMKVLSPYMTDPTIQGAISHVPGSAYAGLLQYQKNADEHIADLQQKAQLAQQQNNKQAFDQIQQQIADIAAEKQKVTAFASQAISPKQIERYQKEGDEGVKWVDKILHDPTSLAGDKASSVIPQLEEAAKTETDPVRKAKIASALSAAKSARDNYFQDMNRKAKAEQVAKQGDPIAAGKMLASGDLTLADLKTRGTDATFILQSTQEAKKIDPSYNPADEVNFEHQAKSPSAAQFFGSARSLLEKGGSLDQLMDWGKKIPNNKLPVLNTVEDWQKLASGKGPLAGYAALVLGVADDYGKVMGGGAASDHARDSALHLFGAAQTQEQRLAAIQGTLGGVGSQYHARIGKNRFFKREYDDFERSPLAQQQEQAQPQQQQKSARPTQQLPPAAQGTVNIQDSKGGFHNIPAGQLSTARQRDPKLQVIQ